MLRVASSIAATSLLCACGGGDIVVKTDLNESFIIKKSAVTTSEKSLDYYRESIMTLIGIQERFIGEMRDRARKCPYEAVNLSQADCNGVWLKGEPAAYEKIAGYKSELKMWEDLFASIKPPIKFIRYRAIFADLNGQKSPMPYRTLICVNPKIGIAKGKKVLKANGTITDENIITAGTSKASDQAALKTCQQYAFRGTTILSSSNE